jgi:hypothetical protein
MASLSPVQHLLGCSRLFTYTIASEKKKEKNSRSLAQLSNVKIYNFLSLSQQLKKETLSVDELSRPRSPTHTPSANPVNKNGKYETAVTTNWAEFN